MLEPLSTTVDAGGNAAVVLRLRNTGDIVEEYHVDVVGDPALWCVIEPSAVRLYPGTTGTVRLSFSPPRSPDSAAGPHPFGVRVTPVENPEAVMVPEGNLTVTPFVDVRAELLPPTVRGWRRAKPRLVVDNYGNTTATAAVLGSSSSNRVDFDIRTPSIQVPPGRAHFSVMRLRPERLLWLGQKVSHPFTTTLQLSGTSPVSASGTYLQSALLPRWMARLFAMLLALAAVFVALWLAIHPSVATEAVADPTISATGTVSIPATPSLTPTPAPTTASPTPPPPTTQAAAPASTTPTITVPNPVNWWKLDDGASNNNEASDVEGNNPGTTTAITWCLPTPPQNGNCAGFNGSTSQIVAQHNALDTSPGNGFTVIANVDLYSGDTGIQTMVSQDSNVSGGSSGFYLQYLGSQSGDWAFSRPGTQCQDVTTPAAVSTWTTVAGVYNPSGSTLKIYVNGVLGNTCTLKAGFPAVASGGDAVMGRAEDGGNDDNWLSGAMNNVQLYNVALSPAQLGVVLQTDYALKG